tara:strand:- start:675 stop:1091 length:417 start_codon:yes stop_codon:yes gene_type:complete
MSHSIPNLYQPRTQFNAAQAIEDGIAIDQKGRKHSIIASTGCFIITQCNNKEHCFDMNGTEKSSFASCRLAEPVKTENRIAHNVVLNTETNKLVFASTTRDKTLRELEKEFNMRVLNTTHPEAKKILEELGIPLKIED